MGFKPHKNFAISTVVTPPSPATSGTTLTVTTGEGSKFSSGSVAYPVVVWPANTLSTSANAEIMLATVSGDSFTLTRAQEGSSARTVIAGDQIAQAITAGVLEDVEGATRPTEQSTSATGAQNNFDLNASFTYLRCTGTAPVFSGFTVQGAAPSPEDRVIIECLGTSVKCVDEATSTAANQIITPSANGQIIGFNGRMELIYDGTTQRWREQVTDPGRPITPTFSAGDYTASAGNWTVDSGDVIKFTYQQRGCNLYITFNIETTDVSSTPTSLRRAMPDGFSAAVQSDQLIQGVNAGVALTAALLRVTTTTMFFFRDTAGTAWGTTSADDTSVRGDVTLEIT